MYFLNLWQWGLVTHDKKTSALDYNISLTFKIYSLTSIWTYFSNKRKCNRQKIQCFFSFPLFPYLYLYGPLFPLPLYLYVFPHTFIYMLPFPHTFISLCISQYLYLYVPLFPLHLDLYLYIFPPTFIYIVLFPPHLYHYSKYFPLPFYILSFPPQLFLYIYIFSPTFPYIVLLFPPHLYLYIFPPTFLYIVLFSPSPLSIWTSRIFRSRITFFPRQVLHRSLGLMDSPFPEQSEHMLWICWTIPGAICWIRTWTPPPLHVLHFSTAPSLPPRPT